MERKEYETGKGYTQDLIYICQISMSICCIVPIPFYAWNNNKRFRNAQIVPSFCLPPPTPPRVSWAPIYSWLCCVYRANNADMVPAFKEFTAYCQRHFIKKLKYSLACTNKLCCYGESNRVLWWRLVEVGLLTVNGMVREGLSGELTFNIPKIWEGVTHSENKGGVIQVERIPCAKALRWEGFRYLSWPKRKPACLEY